MSSTSLTPARLAELWTAFEALERGESTALIPSEGVQRREDPPASDGPWLGVTSSGSTGVPRLVWRSWAELKGRANLGAEFKGWRWASPYVPWSFAGVQVAVQAWLGGGAAVSLPLDYTACWTRLREDRVEALSATPTFVDLLLQHEPEGGGGWSPRLVTLGGEPLREATGRRISRRWPDARFRVIYASAEHGVILKTRRMDGTYETEPLSRRLGGWRVRDDVLELLAGGEWRSTGDLVQVEGDRIRVLGRADSVVNIAGSKISLPQVTEAAESVPGVRRALAVAESSAVTGQIVALRYAVESGCEAAEVLGRLQAHLRQVLPKAAWPRKWELDAVLAGNNAKRPIGV